MKKANYGSQGIKDATELEKREVEKKELAKKRRKERQAEVTKELAAKAILEFIMEVSTNDMMAIKTVIPFINSCDSGEASIAGKDRATINDYLNTGYKYYASYASARNVREHRREQLRKFLALLKRFFSPEQLYHLYPELYDIVSSEADVNEFAAKRKAMTSYYSKDDETDVHLKENVRDYNEQKGEDSDESQQPHVQNAHEPARTSPESHGNVLDVEIPASEEKDAQKSEQASLQSVLTKYDKEDSPKATVDGQTSMAPDGDGGEPQTECGFFHRLKNKNESLFLKMRRWFGEGENEDVCEGENHVENDAIQNDENTSAEKI